MMHVVRVVRAVRGCSLSRTGHKPKTPNYALNSPHTHPPLISIVSPSPTCFNPSMTRLILMSLLLLTASHPLSAQFPQGPPSVERRPAGASTRYTPEQQRLLRLGNPTTRDQSLASYKAQGADAVPELLRSLRSPRKELRILAISALQVAWNDDAEQALLSLLKGPGAADEQKLALRVLRQHLPPAELWETMQPVLHQVDQPSISALLQQLEREGPSEARIRQLLASPQHAPLVLSVLARYQSPDWIPQTRRLAAAGSGSQRAAALAALLYQGDQDAVNSPALQAWLADPDPITREYSAELFLWFGGPQHLPLLRKQLGREQDRFAAATQRAALRAIQQRAQQAPPAYEAAKQRVEALHRYGVEENLAEEGVEARIQALRSYLGYPHPARQQEVPAAEAWLAPTRSFWKRPGPSYGRLIDDQGGPFANSVHVGKDVGWGEVQASVLAIGPGEVKYVSIHAPSWGGIVVLEHQRQDGSHFCSLYAHLAPSISVREGDRVPQDWKLGSIGRGYTWENGGYREHLHFGLHEGPFGNGHWIGGYISPRQFQSSDHGWLNPADILKAPHSR